MKRIDFVSLRFGRDLGKTPPVGPLSLAACAEQLGWQWDLHDCQLDDAVNPFDIDALVKVFRQCDAPVLAVSLFNDAIPLLIGAFDRLGDELSDRRILLGGPGVVGIPTQLLQRIWQVEAVVVGEGETALKSLLDTPSGSESLSGVYRRDQHGSLVGSGRTVREELDRLPRLPWSWCSHRGYSRVPLSTIRGCPFDCSFCEIIAFMGRKVTTRSLELVREDLHDALKAIGTNQIDVLDDTFTLNKRRVLDFCNLMRREFSAVGYAIYSRVDTIDREMMDALASAGCQRVFFGIDAGDDDLLRQISKRTTIAQAEKTVYEAAEYFNVTASFIWGYPYESWLSFVRTVDLAERFMAHCGAHRIQPQLHLLSPSAGTPLFDQYGSEIVFDTGIESSTCGAIAAYQGAQDYREVEAIIRNCPILAAPFYRYTTPEFDRKRIVIDRLNKRKRSPRPC